MDKYVLFDLNSFLHQIGKGYLQECCGGWSIFIFGTQQQCGWAVFLAASAQNQS